MSKKGGFYMSAIELMDDFNKLLPKCYELTYLFLSSYEWE